MKIAFIAPFPPQPDGLSKYTEGIVTGLRGRGHEVHVINASTPSATTNVFGWQPWRLWRTHRFLRRLQPQVIHIEYTIPAFGLSSFLLWPLMWWWKRQAKVVVTFHEVKRETALLGKLGLWYYRWITRCVTSMTVHTYEAMAILATQCRVSHSRISYVPIPLYVKPKQQIFTDAVSTKFNLGNRPIVLFFGFIHVDKGIDYLLKAFDIARRSEPDLKDARLVIAGTVRARKGIFKFFERKDRQYEAKLQALIARRHLKKAVVFTGYVPEEEVSQWFTRANVAVLPYTNLEQSGVVSQALTYRTPIIASELGGLKELLDGTNALVPVANAGALANKLTEFLQNPEMPAALVAEYDRIRRPRTIGRVVARLEKVYES